jgi:site-specific recombinase XerD
MKKCRTPGVLPSTNSQLRSIKFHTITRLRTTKAVDVDVHSLPMFRGDTWEGTRGNLSSGQLSSFPEFESWLRAGNLSEGTIRLRLTHLKWFTKEHDLDTATPEQVIKWLENPRWQPATKLSARASLRSYYRWAMESGRVQADPTAKTRTIKMPPRAIKEAPQDALLTALEGAHERDRLAIMLAAYAGLRRAEIANLHADQIGDRMLTVVGKGSKTRRVPIHPMLEEPLRKVQARGGYAFPNVDGSPITPDAMGRRIARALPGKWSAHSLRHYYAGNVYRASHDIRSVQQLLGHASIATTEIYTQINDDDLHAAVGMWAS